MLESHRSRFAAGAAATLLIVLALAVIFGAFGQRAENIRSSGGVYARAAENVAFWPSEIKDDSSAWTGRLSRLDTKVALLTVRGSPEERGTAHGKLLDAEVRRLVGSVKAYLLPRPNDEEGKKKFAECISGTRVMKTFLEADVIQELEACAKAAGVDADELLLTQLFGDVNRAKGFASFCTAFAAFGPATKDGRLLVGRNFDYAGHGLERTLPLILQEIPTGPGAGRSFVTIGYAGILNGWTAMNEDGLCASNNTLFGGTDRLEGVATCFLLRRIVERCRTVEEGVALIQKVPRACTTGMLVAGRNAQAAWDARFVEFDAEKCETVEPAEGTVLSSNSRQKLAVGRYAPDVNPTCARYQSLKTLLTQQRGKLAFTDKPPVAGSGVYMTINLHCALLDPQEHRLRVSFSDGGGKPAAEFPFQTFEILRDRIVLKE